MKHWLAPTCRSRAPILRQLPSQSIFLTFDDGPCPELTPLLLELLSELKVRATFFVVAKTAAKYPALLQRILSDGHALGSHSLDHRYGAFFSSEGVLQTWIQESFDLLHSLVPKTEMVGFRPPAGVVTPPLRRVLSEMKIPLILWNRRSYDAVWGLSQARALRHAKQWRPGDIVLLHDRQRLRHQKDFVNSVHSMIQNAQKNGLSFLPLSTDLTWQ